MSSVLSDLDIDDVLPDAPFGERHHRVIDAPIEQVWPSCLAVTTREIRTLGPLMALRGLPRRVLRRSTAPDLAGSEPLLDTFVAEGFVLLRCDDRPVDGRARVLFGAAGRFWSPTGNAPIRFDRAVDLLSFDEPGHAVTVAGLDAVDLGDGRTRVETETRVAGTDPSSTKKFAPYWALIRLPSGLIRRSWLAAIDRRASRS